VEEVEAIVNECLVQPQTPVLKVIPTVTCNRRPGLGLVTVDHGQELVVVLKVVSLGTIRTPDLYLLDVMGD